MDSEAHSETRIPARNLALFPAKDIQESSPTTDPHIRLDPYADSPMESLARPVLICGPATDALSLLPTGSVQTVVTSPPYWSLRDYEVANQTGCDDGLGDYVKSIVLAFDQIRRVLTDDGTVWLNVGDSYTSGNRKYRAPDRKNRARAMSVRPPTPAGLKPKDLIGVPWRLAFALQDAGWWVRSEVIWYKPNAHPESVRDRPNEGSRDGVPTVQEPGLLLRRVCGEGSEQPPTPHDVGHQYRTSPTRDRGDRRPPCRDAHDPCSTVHPDHEPLRRRRPRSLRRIRHDPPGSQGTREELGGHRVEIRVRGVDRAQDRRVSHLNGSSSPLAPSTPSGT